LEAFPWPSLRKKHVDIPPLDKYEVAFESSRKRIDDYTFNIDPPGCKDIDDVISLSQINPETNTWRITITIADVACHVPEMSSIDLLASTFGQTLYNDGEAICPMLPPSYSEDACSLLPNVERRGVSLEFEWSPEMSSPKNVKWVESILTNMKSYTYEEFQNDITNLEYKNVVKHSAALLDNSEPIEDSHKWIESFMKFYNIQAAKMLKDVRAGILRRHSKPNQERLEKYSKMDSELAKLAQHAAEYCLATETDSTHFGIQTAAYCHATSPIRRYADLMNQRILKQIIRKNNECLFVSVHIDDLNARSKASKKYEKNMVFIRELIHGPRKITGRILDILENGKIRIWIPSWQKIIKVYLTPTENMNEFISADEKEKYYLNEGQIIECTIAMNLLSRHWKDRLIVNLKSKIE
jgi:exoribonuclease R